MKLVFPNGEHPQVPLAQGILTIGSSTDAAVRIDRPGVLGRQCQLQVGHNGVLLLAPDGAQLAVNGRPVSGPMTLRPGDTVSFDGIEARLVAIERDGVVSTAANDDPGATVVRPALPRYTLRGVGGQVFGRNYPVVGMTTIGRSHECTLLLDEAGLSRTHARLTPMNDGLLLEDLGSTNGSFVNGKRAHRAMLADGDELGFGGLRFRVQAPVQASAAAAAARKAGGGWPRAWIAWSVVAACAVVLLAMWLL